MLLFHLVKFSEYHIDDDGISSFRDSLTEREDIVYTFVCEQMGSKNREKALKKFIAADRNAYLRVMQKIKSHCLQFKPYNKKLDTYQRAVYQCYLNTALMKILMANQYRVAAIEIAKQNYRLAKKYYITEVLMESSKLLFGHVITFEQDKEKGEFYYQENLESHKMLALESKSYYYANLIMSLNSKTQIVTDEIIDLEKAYWEELKGQLFKVNSLAFHKACFMLGFYYLLHIQDYQSSVKLANKAIDYYQSLNFEVTHSLNLIKSKLSYTYICLGRYDEAYLVLREMESSVPKYRVQWYNIIEFLILIDFRKKDFETAILRIRDCTNAPLFKTLHDKVRWVWMYFDCYAVLLELFWGRIDRSTTILKFIGSKHSYFKDKQSKNLNLLILEYLYFLSVGKSDAMIDKEESLERYGRRYLSQRNNYRAHCFLKMLIIISKQNEHPEAVMRHSYQLLQKLLKSKLDITNTAVEAEVIPYEYFWEVIMQFLIKRHRETNPNYRPTHHYLKALIIDQ